MTNESEYRRHALTVRVTHWINAIALILLLMSGLQIFNAHPSLYWGHSSYTGAGPIFELADGFPSWLTIPSGMKVMSGTPESERRPMAHFR